MKKPREMKSYEDEIQTLNDLLDTRWFIEAAIVKIKPVLKSATYAKKNMYLKKDLVYREILENIESSLKLMLEDIIPITEQLCSFHDIGDTYFFEIDFPPLVNLEEI